MKKIYVLTPEQIQFNSDEYYRYIDLLGSLKIEIVILMEYLNNLRSVYNKEYLTLHITY